MFRFRLDWNCGLFIIISISCISVMRYMVSFFWRLDGLDGHRRGWTVTSMFSNGIFLIFFLFMGGIYVFYIHGYSPWQLGSSIFESIVLIWQNKAVRLHCHYGNTVIHGRIHELDTAEVT